MPNLCEDHLHSVAHLHPVYPTGFSIFLQKLVKIHYFQNIENPKKRRIRKKEEATLIVGYYFYCIVFQCIDYFLCNHLQNINTCKRIWESTQLDFLNVVVARKYSCIKKNMRITMTFCYLCVIYCLW
jgi:hypothetical protein